MASTSEIKKGLVFRYNNDIFVVTEFLHVKPGKGAAFVRTKMKSVTNGKVLDNNFPSGATIDVVAIQYRQFQFLYTDDNGINLMDQETFDQISIPEYLIDFPKLLKEGMNITVLIESATERPLSAQMPDRVALEVTYAEPGVKGDTANNPTKRATLESGYELQVPMFINTGDKIRVETEKGLYVDRVKE
jgi:elongation factor P